MAGSLRQLTLTSEGDSSNTPRGVFGIRHANSFRNELTGRSFRQLTRTGAGNSSNLPRGKFAFVLAARLGAATISYATVDL